MNVCAQAPCYVMICLLVFIQTLDISVLNPVSLLKNPRPPYPFIKDLQLLYSNCHILSLSFQLFLLVTSSWAAFCCSWYMFESVRTAHVIAYFSSRLVLSHFRYLLPTFSCPPYDTSTH